MATKDEKEKEKNAREQLGKFFYDLAKMTFGVMVLGNVVTLLGLTELTINTVISFVMGVVATWAFAYMGNKILRG